MKMLLLACFVICAIPQAHAAVGENNASSHAGTLPPPSAATPAVVVAAPATPTDGPTLDVTTKSADASGSTAAPELWFNPALLSDNGGAVADLSTFQAGQQMPGVYLVDIYLNGEFVASRNQAFIARPEGKAGSGVSGTATVVDDTGLIPALTMRDLESFGVKMALLTVTGQKAASATAPSSSSSSSFSWFSSSSDEAPVIDPGQQVDLEALIASSSTAFDFSRQRLDISIPQASIDRRAIGEVPVSMWDEGVNALLLSYNFTGSKNSGDDTVSDSNFLGLNSGLNIGPWRLRSNATWNRSDEDEGSGNGGDDEWQHVSTTLARAIIPLKSELVMGDSSTGSEVFDSVSFRGAQLASDDSMYPDSQQGYAPTVRGVAKTNAKVTIKQDAAVLYQTYVSPGPFIIEDLYSTYDNGDLQVEIEETDGSVTRYSVPYSSVPNMLREGRTQYGLTVGNYRAMNDEQNEPTFLQGSLVMGLSDGFTLFGGTQLSEDYRAVAAGVSKNLGDWGGVSVDLTHAFTELPDGTDAKGQSIRALYSKSLNDYGTDLELMNARYSTEEFYTFADSTYKSMSGFYTPDNVDPDTPDWAYQYNLNYAKKGRMEVNLGQELGDNGSIFLNLSQQTYWNTSEEESLAQLGYSGSWGSVTYNLAYNYSKSQFQPDADKVFSLNLSFPIGQLLLGDPQSAMYANYSSSYDDEGKSVHNIGVSGVALEDDSLNYNLQQGYESEDDSVTGTASLRYTGGRGNATLGYNYGEGHQQVNYGLTGGIIAHADGVTFGQPLGNTNVLVAAPGADGARIKNSPGNYTDWRGYGVVSYASEYRNNRIELDINSLGTNVDLDQAVDNVVPTEGAVVKADFSARVGVRALLTLTHSGQAIPFGAQVSETTSQAVGVVSDGGVVYLSGLPLKGALEVTWGSGADQSCQVNYQLPEEAQTLNIARAALICQ